MAHVYLARLIVTSLGRLVALKINKRTGWRTARGPAIWPGWDRDYHIVKVFSTVDDAETGGRGPRLQYIAGNQHLGTVINAIHDGAGSSATNATPPSLRPGGARWRSTPTPRERPESNPAEPARPLRRSRATTSPSPCAASARLAEALAFAARSTPLRHQAGQRPRHALRRADAGRLQRLPSTAPHSDPRGWHVAVHESQALPRDVSPARRAGG